MLTIRRYKRKRSGEQFWEYKILYRDFFTNKIKSRKRHGFSSKQECEIAAAEMMGYLKLKELER